MHIVVVGGLERIESVLDAMAVRAGHTVEFHRGHIQGRGSIVALESMVDRSDLVVIVTDVNSHGAVGVAKKAARRRGVGALVLRNCGPARFQGLLDAIDARDATRTVGAVAVA